jgi:hypothetical protein
VLPNQPRKRRVSNPTLFTLSVGGSPWMRGLPTLPWVGCRHDRARSPVRIPGGERGVSPNRSIQHPQHGSGGNSPSSGPTDVEGVGERAVVGCGALQKFDRGGGGGGGEEEEEEEEGLYFAIRNKERVQTNEAKSKHLRASPT